MEDHAKRRETIDLLESLHSHFGSNISQMTPDIVTLVDKVDISSRQIDNIRITVLREYCGDDKQKIGCADLLGEIFADFSQAMYLFSIGLIVPARMLVRGALELGLAFLYFWDMPHEYWGWSKHGSDLNITGMIEHLGSQKYAAHLANVNGTSACDPAYLKKTYRDLSETVHGKFVDMPALSPRRFNLLETGVDKHFHMTVGVQRALVDLWCGRFPNLRTFIDRQSPQQLLDGSGEQPR